MPLLTPEASPSREGPPATAHHHDATHLERPANIFNDKPSPPFSRVVGLFEVLRDSKPAARKDRLDHWFNVRSFILYKFLYFRLDVDDVARYGGAMLETTCTRQCD